MYFRFTLFNGITLFVMAVTIGMIYARLHFRLESNWFFLYYAVILGYWKGFGGSLDPYWVFAGLAAALLLRFEFLEGLPLKMVRGLELVFFGYVLWRGMGLLLLWPW